MRECHFKGVLAPLSGSDPKSLTPRRSRTSPKFQGKFREAEFSVNDLLAERSFTTKPLNHTLLVMYDSRHLGVSENWVSDTVSVQANTEKVRRPMQAV